MLNKQHLIFSIFCGGVVTVSVCVQICVCLDVCVHLFPTPEGLDA